MISNKFREEKSYVICGRFFYRPWNVLEVHNCRPCGLRRSKSPPCWSYGWTPLPARRAHALASHFSLVVVGLVGRGASAVSGGTRQGHMAKGNTLWTMTGNGIFSRTAMRSNILGMALAGRGHKEWRLVLHFRG